MFTWESFFAKRELLSQILNLSSPVYELSNMQSATIDSMPLSNSHIDSKYVNFTTKFIFYADKLRKALDYFDYSMMETDKCHAGLTKCLTD